jgi:hypothetical protein
MLLKSQQRQQCRRARLKKGPRLRLTRTTRLVVAVVAAAVVAAVVMMPPLLKMTLQPRKYTWRALARKNTLKITKLASKVISLLSKCNVVALKLQGPTKERTINIDAWLDKISQMAFQHPKLVKVFENCNKNRTLTKPDEKWVDEALYNILAVFVDVTTRQALDPDKINTKSGVAFWNLLKEHALGNKEVNKEQALRRLTFYKITPGQQYLDYIEEVLRLVFVCRQNGDVISDDQIVRHILSGLRISSGDHNAHVAALQALHIQKKGTLTVKKIQEYFRLIPAAPYQRPFARPYAGNAKPKAYAGFTSSPTQGNTTMPNRLHDPAGKRTYVPGRNNPRSVHFRNPVSELVCTLSTQGPLQN